jgi:hypothetical protein
MFQLFSSVLVVATLVLAVRAIYKAITGQSSFTEPSLDTIGLRAASSRIFGSGEVVRVLSRTGRRVRRIGEVVERLDGGRVLLRSELTGRKFVRSSKRLLAA